MKYRVVKNHASKVYVQTLEALLTSHRNFTDILCRTPEGLNSFKTIIDPFETPFIQWTHYRFPEHVEEFSTMKIFYLVAMVAKFFDLVENTLPGKLLNKETLPQTVITNIHKQKDPFKNRTILQNKSEFFDLESYYNLSIEKIKNS